MAATILVLNAGSSSLKFSLFLVENKTLQPVLGDQLEGLNTTPRFQARDAAGTVIGEHRWEAGHRLGHDGVIAYLTDFLRQYRSEYHLVAVGHRVVHGGIEYSAPVRVDAETLEQLERLVPPPSADSMPWSSRPASASTVSEYASASVSWPLG